MTLQDFRELYDAEPFRPFTIHLASGRQVNLQHPDFAAVPPVGSTVVVFSPEGRMNIINLHLVTVLEADQAPDDQDEVSTSPGNAGSRE